MKNIEKYYDDIKSEIDNWNNNDCIIRKTRDKTHLLSCDSECRDCRLKNLEWLNAEYQEPIKLTHAEKVILESLDKDCIWIHRKAFLSVFNKNPNESIIDKYYDLLAFDHLFQFVKDEPLEIAWLLENCEVVEE